jgi:hypothetical protein
VNLHYHCAQLFHFDIPWSLIRLTQRNGRIDRFGQKHVPHLHYLMTRTRDATADQHVMKRLVEKEATATRQLGDVGAQLGLYDPEAEERYLTEGVAAGRDVEELMPDAPLGLGQAEAALGGDGDGDEDVSAIDAPPIDAEAETGAVDLVALLAALEGEPAAPEAVQPRAAKAFLAEPAPEGPPMDLVAMLKAHEEAEAKAPPVEKLVAIDPSLFADDYAFMVAALRHLEKLTGAGDVKISWEHDDAHRTLKITAPEAFRAHKEPFLPAEAVPANGIYQLVQSREEVAKRLRGALEGDGSWPAWHLLWEQHPLMEWLLDALAASYSRLEAPVLRLASLPKGATFFLVSALLYNTEGQAVYASWFALEAKGPDVSGAPVPFGEFAARVGLAGEMVNPGKASARLGALQALVEPVIRRAREVVATQRTDAMKALRIRARNEARRVVEWQTRSLEALKARRERAMAKQGRVPALLERKLLEEERSVARVHQNHAVWLKSLVAEGAPYVRLVAVFSGE